MGVKIKVTKEICAKRGMEIEIPSFDKRRPLYEYSRKWGRVILKHGWQYHRLDFPPQFKSFTQFMRWLSSPEGKEWDQKQGSLDEAEGMVQESQRGL